MQIFAYLTNTFTVRKPLNVQRMHRHEYSSTREPEDFIGHTREAAKPSAALPQKQRPSILDRLRTRRRKFHVAESGALTVRWIDTGRNQP